MLGQDLNKILTEEGFNVTPSDVDTLDITDEKAVKEYLAKHDFDIVLHIAAFTDVDKAESKKRLSYRINKIGSENLAKYTAKTSIPILYISTDYVFDGTKQTPYETFDAPNPLNVYGFTKYKGEEAVKKHNPNHYIVRTSWLYGHKGRNFVEVMIYLASVMPELKIVSDQIGCPTWTVDLCYGIVKLIKEKSPYGIYHVCGSGQTSWYGFAEKIFEFMNLDTKIVAIPTEEFPRPATRPKNSVMNNNNICPPWEESLKKYIELRSTNLPASKS